MKIRYRPFLTENGFLPFYNTENIVLTFTLLLILCFKCVNKVCTYANIVKIQVYFHKYVFSSPVKLFSLIFIWFPFSGPQFFFEYIWFAYLAETSFIRLLTATVEQ